MSKGEENLILRTICGHSFNLKKTLHKLLSNYRPNSRKKAKAKHEELLYQQHLQCIEVL